MKPALMTFRTFVKKKKTLDQKLRNLTCLYIALKPIQVDSTVKQAKFSGKTSLLLRHNYVSMATTLP